MIEYLKNPIIFSITIGFVATVYFYINNEWFHSNEESYTSYLKHMTIISLATYVLLRYYHIPQKIFTESMRTGPAPF